MIDKPDRSGGWSRRPLLDAVIQVLVALTILGLQIGLLAWVLG